MLWLFFNYYIKLTCEDEFDESTKVNVRVWFFFSFGPIGFGFLSRSFCFVKKKVLFKFFSVIYASLFIYLLGFVQELDPPPWLNRMREIGYPPGYLGI